MTCQHGSLYVLSQLAPNGIGNSQWQQWQRTGPVNVVKLVRNVMAHAQKPDFVFPQNGRVHLNRRGRQFSRLLAAEVCASASVMLDRPRSEVAWEYWLPNPFASFPFTSPPWVTVCHQVPNELYSRTNKIQIINFTPFFYILLTLIMALSGGNM